MITSLIAKQTGISIPQIEKVQKLLSEQCTVPFIARYRKEMTGGLDEVAIQNIKLEEQSLTELQKRKEGIIATLEELAVDQNVIEKIKASWDSKEVEDLYLPFKPKRKTKATVAHDAGITPLAKMIMKQSPIPLFDKANQFISDSFPTAEDVLQGARHIIAEWISENMVARDMVRKSFQYAGEIQVKWNKEKDEDGKFKQFDDRKESLKRCPGHRFLAMLRGEEEGMLKVKITPDMADLNQRLGRYYVKSNGELAEQIELSIADALKRLIVPSIENEVRKEKKDAADKEAIGVFSENLRQLLLAPPVGKKRVLAIDPGFRTGCKVVCLDEHGTLLYNETIYPHPPKNEKIKAQKKIASLVSAYKIEAIAIGNGTAGRETEYFIKGVRFDRKLNVYVVNEAGASVYSASKIAREEFPNYDVTVRGAVSIGRRLCDPLAELVKIDPKSIGVGQYQHDVNQKWLKEALDEVVVSCVNHVGVSLNTASKHLLSYVSGLSETIAQNIVDYRKENGSFQSRQELKKVPRLGDKAFEQCAGFLRIADAKEILDQSAVHPESYGVVKEMAKNAGLKLEDIIGSKEQVAFLQSANRDFKKVGELTKKSLFEELEKAGRDPRKVVLQVEFDPNIRKVSDLQVDQELKGIVTNITNFGAFVDVGVKQGGLVHISQITDRFISNPNEVLKINQVVNVKVVQVDVDKNRVGFTMKGVEQPKY